MGGARLLPHLVLAQVDELSEAAQQVVHKYTGSQSRGQAGKYASLCAASGILPWDPPTAQDHATLLEVALNPPPPPPPRPLQLCTISICQCLTVCAPYCMWMFIHIVWNMKITYQTISDVFAVLKHWSTWVIAMTCLYYNNVYAAKSR